MPDKDGASVNDYSACSGCIGCAYLPSLQVKGPTAVMSRRTRTALLLLLANAVAACQPNGNDTPNESALKFGKPKIAHFHVNLYSYLERPISDVMLNGKFIGDAAGQPHHGRGGLITGVPVPIGEQTITWRLGGPEGMPGNGDTVHTANKPILRAPDDDETYLGVHVYPDNTVELVPEKFWPNKTQRGETINRRWKMGNGAR